MKLLCTMCEWVENNEMSILSCALHDQFLFRCLRQIVLLNYRLLSKRKMRMQPYTQPSQDN